MNRAEYSAVFISPHLDDAVFSCAGKIAELSLSKKVLVINVFTSFEKGVSVGAVVLGDERLIEEACAAKILSYDHINLNEKDAFFRGFRKGSIGKVFYPPVKEDFIYLETLREKIGRELEKISFSELYVPLGIGWHIDHCLIHRIFNDKNNPYAEKLRFYEDAPYIFFPGARAERLAYLRGESTSFIKNLISVSRAFFHSGFTQNIKKFPQRYLIMPFMAGYFMRVFFMQRKSKKVNFFPRLRVEVFNCNSHYEKKMTAVMCYTSQVKEFFESIDKMRESYKNYSREVIHCLYHSEQYWLPENEKVEFNAKVGTKCLAKKIKSEQSPQTKQTRLDF
ncbi:MAG: PIG-L family deacetylase [Bdellovibrionales bacterium]|nr:PIG-L family deacetylase [Bdellovibrionales bacterium]